LNLLPRCLCFNGTYCVSSMANNSTAFILPQWLLLKEPGMTCRPHSTIIGMLAVYNIVSTAVAVMTAGPFFCQQKQQFWNWKRRTLDRLLPWLSCGSGREDERRLYGQYSFWPFTISVLGSVAIALAAPLLAGISISRNHEHANRWVLIEQWSTRPRATFFVVTLNLIMAVVHHRKEISAGSHNPDLQEDGYLESALIAIFTEFFVGFFGIRFLWEQAQIRSSTLYQSSTPCTTLGTEGNPSNCPDMEFGANGLVMAIVLNGLITVILLLVVAKNKIPTKFIAFLGCTFITLQCIFMFSWQIWTSFLHRATDEMYCIESSTPIDVIYCLLPVFLGLWRLAWSARGRRDSSIVP